MLTTHPATQAVLAATKRSLAALRKRLGGSLGVGAFFLERPFFNVSLQLAVPNVICSPSLADIQGAINAAAKKVRAAQGESPVQRGSVGCQHQHCRAHAGSRTLHTRF